MIIAEFLLYSGLAFLSTAIALALVLTYIAFKHKRDNDSVPNLELGDKPQ